MPELRPWRAARPHATRVANAVRPRLARAAGAVRPGLTRATDAVQPYLVRTVAAVKPQVTRLARIPRPKAVRTWQYTAGAATAGLALAATVATAAGPWDSSGQRTAERDRAVALERTGGTDHGGDSGSTAAGPGPAPSAPSVLTALGGAANTVKSAPTGQALAAVLGPLLGNTALGTRHTAAVVDVATGKRLYGAGAGTALTPPPPRRSPPPSPPCPPWAPTTASSRARPWKPTPRSSSSSAAATPRSPPARTPRAGRACANWPRRPPRP